MKRFFKYSIQVVILSGVTACISYSCGKKNDDLAQEIYTSLGEVDGLKSITDSFMVNVSLDTAILPPFTAQGIFDNTNKTLNYRNNLVDFLCQQLNGPCVYKAGIIFNLSDSIKAITYLHMEDALFQNTVVGEPRDSVLAKFTNFLSFQSAL